MFVTIVEGAVEPGRERDLRSAWEVTAAGALPAGFIESSLLRAEDGTWAGRVGVRVEGSRDCDARIR
jgi:hypothetical protein